MPIDWTYLPGALSFPPSPPGPGRSHRDRRKIAGSRHAANPGKTAGISVRREDAGDLHVAWEVP